MNSNRVHLTFPTDRETSERLTKIAHSCGITQPQLIDEICKDFIKFIDEVAKKELKNEIN